MTERNRVGSSKVSFCFKSGAVGAAMAVAIGGTGLLQTNAALLGSVVGISTEMLYRQYIAKEHSSYAEIFIAGLQGAAIFYVGSTALSLDANAMSTMLAEGFLTGYVHYNDLKSDV